MGVVEIRTIPRSPFPIPQLGIGIGNWQQFHIGNIIYILYTFYTAKNMIRPRSVNSMHSVVAIQLSHSTTLNSSTKNSSTVLHTSVNPAADKKDSKHEPCQHGLPSQIPDNEADWRKAFLVKKQYSPSSDRCRQAQKQKHCPDRADQLPALHYLTTIQKLPYFTSQLNHSDGTSAPRRVMHIRFHSGL